MRGGDGPVPHVRSAAAPEAVPAVACEFVLAGVVCSDAGCVAMWLFEMFQSPKRSHLAALEVRPLPRLPDLEAARCVCPRPHSRPRRGGRPLGPPVAAQERPLGCLNVLACTGADSSCLATPLGGWTSCEGPLCCPTCPRSVRAPGSGPFSSAEADRRREPRRGTGLGSTGGGAATARPLLLTAQAPHALGAVCRGVHTHAVQTRGPRGCLPQRWAPLRVLLCPQPGGGAASSPSAPPVPSFFRAPPRMCLLACS